MSDEKKPEYEFVLTARFSGSGVEGSKVFSGLEGCVYKPAPHDVLLEDARASSDDSDFVWEMEFRTHDRGYKHRLAPLIQLLSAERQTFKRIGVRCIEIRCSTFNIIPMATLLSLEPHEVAMLAELQIPVSLRLAYPTDDNKNIDLPRAEYFGKGPIDIALGFYGFELDPDLITQRTGEEPSSIGRIGDIYWRGLREQNAWVMSEWSDDHTMDELINEYITDVVQPALFKVADLDLITTSEVRLGLFREYPDDDVSEVRIEPQLINKIANLGTGFEICMYFSTYDDDEVLPIDDTF